MNHALWNAAAARVIAMAFVVAGLTACGDRLSNTHSRTPTPDAASPSAVVIGTAPAQPTGDPPGTTPVASDHTEVSKTVEQQRMPLPGQPNDHSNVAPGASQKADSDANRSPSAAANANNGTQERTPQ